MSAAMTAQLVTDALVMAIWRRGGPDALLYHPDPGGQYTGQQFQRLMTGDGVVCSTSRSGKVWDNAAWKASSRRSRPSALATEVTVRDETKADVFDYIKGPTTPKRRRSTIRHLSPLEFEQIAGFA
jgi:putative transposase